LEHRRCSECDRTIQEIKRKIPINASEINESMLSPNGLYENFYDAVHDQIHSIDDDAIFSHDIKNWLSKEDPRVVRIVELIYFHDYSVKAAAEKVGLSGAGANMKLKELSKNKIVKELFGR
jgi:hypothetical protein